MKEPLPKPREEIGRTESSRYFGSLFNEFMKNPKQFINAFVRNREQKE
jgi:hypothetical protein